MLYASGVSIPSDLTGALSGPGSPGYNAQSAINANLNTSKRQLGMGASTLGRNGAAAIGPGSYAGNQSAVQGGLATGGLESALGGGLGNTGYENQLQQRQFGQNEALASQVAALNKPNLLQQILGGISLLAKPMRFNGVHYG